MQEHLTRAMVLAERLAAWLHCPWLRVDVRLSREAPLVLGVVFDAPVPQKVDPHVAGLLLGLGASLRAAAPVRAVLPAGALLPRLGCELVLRARTHARPAIGASAAARSGGPARGACVLSLIHI